MESWSWTLTHAVLSFLCLPHARTPALEVRLRLFISTLYNNLSILSQLPGCIRSGLVTIISLIWSLNQLVNTEIILTLWSGGFALLYTAGLASTSVIGGLAPVLGGLGLVGVAGAAGMTVMSLMQCGGPFRCTSASGQCCRLLFSIRGPICPASC